MPRGGLRPAGWLTAGVFLVLAAIYVLSPVRTAYDSRWSIHTAMSIARGHGGDLSAYLPVLEANGFYAIERSSGAPRTAYPVGPSLLALPVVVLVAAIDPAFEPRLRDRVPDKFERAFASVVGAVAAALFFRLLLRQFGRVGTALAGTVVFALGSTMWSDATRALWQHGPMVLCLVVAMGLLLRAEERPGLVQWAGVPLAVAYMMRPTAALPILVFSIFVLVRHRGWFLRYAGWATLAGAPWLVFNWATVGVLPPYYLVASGDGPGGDAAAGLAGVLFSPGRGLFVYSPVFVLSVVGFGMAMRERGRLLYAAFGLVVVATVGLVAQWPIWWGGHCYGPRLLTDVVPFLAFFAAFALDRALRVRWGAVGAAGLVVASVAMHAPGALSMAGWRWNVTPTNVDTDTARLWDWRGPAVFAVGAVMRLSLIMPAYNERQTLGAILALVSRALPGVAKQVVVVEDCSTDGTREWLRANVGDAGVSAPGFIVDAAGGLVADPSGDLAETTVVAVFHPQNRGKGAAIRTGLLHVDGDVVVIQDADLEYDPADLAVMFDLIAGRRVADVVYGSRFYGKPHRSLYFHHYMANRTISFIFNVLYNQTLTDIECCYKMMSAEVAQSLRLSADDFGIEIEISAALARQRRLRIYEMGISYYGRSYAEGKKIGWRDGLLAFWYLAKYRVRTLRVGV